MAYAIAEIVIGLTALVFHPIFTSYLSLSYDHIFPALNSSFMSSLYKWCTAPLLILPQTILLGATFPLISSGIIRRYNDTPGHTISILYFVNSLGGAIGVLLSGFYLIERFTFPGTVGFAGLIDLIVGAGVLILCWFSREKSTNAKGIKVKKPQAPPAIPLKIDSVGWVMLIVAGVTAASSFMYEIGWVRMLSLVLGSSTHSFELMLSAFIFGLAIGGFWIKNKIDSFKNPIAALAIIQVVMGICAIATLVFYSKLFYLMQFLLRTLNMSEQGYLMFNIYSHLICLVLMLPATICAGMTLPIITWYLYKKNSDESMIGKVYAFNTVGSIIGVLLAIQLLMPFVGLKFLLITGGVIDMLVGVFLVYYFKEQASKRLTLVLTSLTLIVTVIPAVSIQLDPALLSSGVYRNGTIHKDRETLFYKDGKTSTVALVTRVGCYSLSNNGKPDASVGVDSSEVTLDEHTQILLAAYPLSYAKKCDNVGVIGLGSGMTASVLLESDAIKHMDVVEIEPYIVDAAKMMGPKVRKVFNDSRSQIHIEDAKTFFSANKKKYDLIISEPSNPWVSGVSSLFSVEFFKLISCHLTPEGMLVQWLHLYEMNPDLIASILMSVDKNFLDYKVFESGSDVIILASNNPISNTPGNEVFKNPRLADLLRKINFEYDYDFKSNYIGGKNTLHHLANMFDIPLNSDYNPVLDLRAVKARFTHSNAEGYGTMGRFIIPVRRILEDDTMTVPHVMYGRSVNMKGPSGVNINADYQAWQAWYYITSRGSAREAFADSVVLRQVAFAVAQVRMAARDNATAVHQIWPKNVLDLLRMTMPYLPPTQIKDVWSYIDEEGKNINVRQESKDVLKVLKCISFGEYDTAQQLSLKCMKENRTLTEEYVKILAVAHMLSSIKLNKTENVEEVWNNMGKLQYDFNIMTLFNHALVNKAKKDFVPD